MVEHELEAFGVVGSIPTLGTILCVKLGMADQH